MVPKHSCLYITNSNRTIVRRLRSLYWSSVFQVNGEGNCVWYNNICLTEWPPSTPTRFTCFVTAMGQSASAMTPFNWYVRVHNGSLCLMATEYTDSVLFALWPQWVRVRVQWLRLTGTCVCTMGHCALWSASTTTRFIWSTDFYLTEYEKSLLLIE